MEHHRPHQRDGDRRGHHRHDEDAAQHAAKRELAVEDQRRDGAQHQRRDDREHGEVERAPDRLEEALVGERAPCSCRGRRSARRVPIFQSNALIHIVNSHGKMMTAPTTTSAGTMNQ